MLELPGSLNLHVEEHLSATDAARQCRTAAEILRRFDAQPGVVLGDEVGMGKTFVALAVAASYVVHDPTRPVVVMVPAGVLQKWLRDADTFRSACLKDDQERERFRVRDADSGVDFLKLLDDEGQDKATLILLSHGALHRKLADRWVKLAVLQASIKGRHGIEALRLRLARFAPMLLRDASAPDQYTDLYFELLSKPTSDWRRVLVREGWLEAAEDDPVPEAFAATLAHFDLAEVYEQVISVLPERASPNINERIKQARRALDNARDGVFPKVWQACLKNMNLSLPLLVLDEAHRVRNAHTQLASLLAESHEDLDAAGGQLAQAFDRMLFLTATPFQLGHGELHSVLSRFTAVRWDGPRAPTIGRDVFRQSIDALHQNLDAMQIATDRLERAWKRLLASDCLEAIRDLSDEWWLAAGDSEAGASALNITNERVRAVILEFRNARQMIHRAEAGLQPWVLRHTRARYLPPPYDDIARRQRIEGAAVRTDIGGEDLAGQSTGGLQIAGEGSLPFFLSARLSTIPDCPRVFGEGIASSFEALLNTHRDDLAEEDQKVAAEPVPASRGSWYVERLRKAAHTLEAQGYKMHPKLATTVDLAMALWRSGEKVLIFCHYRETGGALHRALSEVMLNEIEHRGCERFACNAEELPGRLEGVARRWDKGEPAALAVVGMLDVLMDGYPKLFTVDGGNPMSSEDALIIRERIQGTVLRFLRTPTFLLRFAPPWEKLEPEEFVRQCFDRKDSSGMSFRALVEQFLRFLASRPSASNRMQYLDALLKVQTGTHVGREVDEAFADDAAASGRVKLVPNVRRVFGDTRDETRQRIMLTFNTPFYPEILIASSVMAEGVDLHINCRHIIHHDLDWNPSALEQRTGRIDRLGAKAEQCGQSIRVYIPYLEGCQDEKMFRVVTDRERWFGVVMGAEQSMERVLNATVWELERMAEQPPVPESMTQMLTMSLGA